MYLCVGMYLVVQMLRETLDPLELVVSCLRGVS